MSHRFQIVVTIIRKIIRNQALDEVVEEHSVFNDTEYRPTETRGFVHLDSKPGEISADTIDVLVDRYLIRREWRAGAPWYELTHDRLIKPIKESNKAWRYRREEEKAKALAETSERIRSKYSKLKIVLPIIAAIILVSSVYISYNLGQQHAVTTTVANGYSFLKKWGRLTPPTMDSLVCHTM